MSSIAVFEKFGLFHVTEEARGEAATWINVVRTQKPDLTHQEQSFAEELTLLAAAEYAAFFGMIEATIPPSDRAIQVDPRPVRAAEARFDTPPSWCTGIERFVAGDARISELFLFTSDVQKFEEAIHIDVSSRAIELTLDELADAVRIYREVLAGTWLGSEEVALNRIAAVWLARWTTNRASDISAAGELLEEGLKLHPELFGLLAYA